MNNAPCGGCQSASVAPRLRWRMGWIAFCVGLLMTAYARAETPAPTPPAWQRDLDAARILQTTFALTPAADPAAEIDRRQRLAELYGQLVARYPEQAEIQKVSGAFYEQNEQPALAASCWLRAESLDPHDAATADALGSLFLKNGRLREACKQFERAVSECPETAAYHFDLANVLYLFRKELIAPPGRPDEQAVLAAALEHFRRAAELAPTDLRLAKAYAETFYIFRTPDWQQALAAWKTVLDLSGGQTDFANGHLARISRRLGRLGDMEMYLDRIRDPGYDALKAGFRRKTDAPPPSPSAR